MKKIQPARRYDLDDGYPSDTEATLRQRGESRRLRKIVQRAIIPPAAPNPPADPDPPGRPRLGSVPPIPRHRGCASCSTAAEPKDLLLPLGLTVLGLHALRRRENGHDA